MDTSNHLCNRCRLQPATVYCTCQGPLIYLCASCIVLHFQDLPDPTHSIKNYRAVGAKLAEMQRKEDEEYRQAQKAVAGIPGELETLIQPMINEWKGKLAQHHAALHQTIRDCENSDTSPGFFKGQRLYEVSINQAKRDAFFAALRDLVTLNLQIPGKSLSNYFPFFQPGRLNKISLDQRTAVSAISLMGANNINADTVCFLMQDERIFACGGTWHANAYLVDAWDGTVHNLPSMQSARAWHGLVYFNGEMMVFGGAYSSQMTLAACEGYNLTDGRWNQFGPMSSPRAGINPCELGSNIYVAGGGCNSIERYNTRGQMFELLNATLPGTKWCMCLRSGASLLVLGNGSITKYDIQGKDCTQVESATGLFQSWYSVVCPLASDTSAYFFHPYQTSKELIALTFSPLGHKKLATVQF